MFDSGVALPALGASQLAGLIEQNHAELMVRECRMLQLAVPGLMRIIWTQAARSISR